MEQEKCKKCGKDSEGYKCDTCGAEAETHDEQHSCGGEHCMSKCSECSEAEEKCSCRVM